MTRAAAARYRRARRPACTSGPRHGTGRGPGGPAEAVQVAGVSEPAAAAQKCGWRDQLAAGTAAVLVEVVGQPVGRPGAGGGAWDRGGAGCGSAARGCPWHGAAV